MVAVVRAAAVARSTEPAKVAEALPGLQAGTADGVAGPALDFAGTEAVPDDAVVPLASTSVSPGVRPEAPEPSLFWFESAGS